MAHEVFNCSAYFKKFRIRYNGGWKACVTLGKLFGHSRAYSVSSADRYGTFIDDHFVIAHIFGYITSGICYVLQIRRTVFIRCTHGNKLNLRPSHAFFDIGGETQAPRSNITLHHFEQTWLLVDRETTIIKHIDSINIKV